MKKDKNIKDKLIASFSVGIGFWLINISQAYVFFYYYILGGAISGLSFILLFFFSIKAIKQKEKILGWTYLIMDAIMILSWIILFMLGYIRIF